jgi:serine protease AprX
MKTIHVLLLIVIFLLPIQLIEAQVSQLPKYRVEFKDKNNTTYSLSNPIDYLSNRAIQRRINQGIAIDSTDLPVNQTYINGVLSIGGTLLTKTKWFNAITIAVSDTTIIPAILALPYVAYVERTYPPFGRKTDKKQRPRFNIESYGDDFSLNYDNMLDAKFAQDIFSIKTINYGAAYNQVNMIGVDYLHAIGFTGEGMVIAVLDAGFYDVDNLLVFDSLRSSGKILGTYDFVNPGGNVYTQNTHGMMVLSTMGANLPGQLVGTAPHASYWLLRTEDAPTEYRIEEDNWIAGAEFADSVGADIINSSLGYTEFYDPAQDYTYSDMDGNTARVTKGANMASSKGILVVNSAGNSGNSPWHYIGAPADGFDVLTIGAVDDNGIIADFSSRGPTFDGRTKPNVVAVGKGTQVVFSSGNIGPGNGTSFSGPIIAGAAACLWQAHPTLTNTQVKSFIEQSASKYPLYDTIYGYGIPNFAAAYVLVSREKVEEDPFILAYPNPFDDEVFIVFQSAMSQKVNVEIVDQRGKRISSKNNIQIEVGYNNISLDRLKGKSNGIYFLRIVTKNEVYVKRLMKM